MHFVGGVGVMICGRSLSGHHRRCTVTVLRYLGCGSIDGTYCIKAMRMKRYFFNQTSKVGDFLENSFILSIRLAPLFLWKTTAV